MWILVCDTSCVHTLGPAKAGVCGLYSDTWGYVGFYRYIQGLGLPTVRAPFFSSYTEDYNIFGSVFGLLCFGKYHVKQYRVHSPLFFTRLRGLGYRYNPMRFSLRKHFADEQSFASSSPRRSDPLSPKTALNLPQISAEAHAGNKQG